MRFETGDIVAANTTEKTSQEIKIKINQGVITEWDIGAFDEAADLLHLKILHVDFQLLPFNRDKSLRPGLLTKPIPDQYEIHGPPYEFRLLAWNEDDSYTHEYWVGITILPFSVAGTSITSPSLIEKIKSIIGL